MFGSASCLSPRVHIENLKFECLCKEIPWPVNRRLTICSSVRCFTEGIVGYNVISPSISTSGGHSLILDLELCDFAPFPATDMLDRDPSVPSLSLSGQSNQLQTLRAKMKTLTLRTSPSKLVMHSRSLNYGSTKQGVFPKGVWQ